MLMNPCQQLLSTDIENGTLDDYHRLGQFHYKASKPATMANIYRLVHRAPTVVSRYLKRNDETQTIGVLVMSYPVLHSRGRNVATAGRYQHLSPRETARVLNNEMRTISRVVIEPRWCGAGLAVRLVRYALEHAETIYTEAHAAMGRVNPFFERAGMTRIEQPMKPENDRLLAALSCCGIDSNRLASKDVVQNALRDLNVAKRNWLTKQLRRWVSTLVHYDSIRVNEMTIDQMFDMLRMQLLTEPVYYLYRSMGDGIVNDDISAAYSCGVIARLHNDT